MLSKMRMHCRTCSTGRLGGALDLVEDLDLGLGALFDMVAMDAILVPANNQTLPT